MEADALSQKVEQVVRDHVRLLGSVIVRVRAAEKAAA
jgi:hypothetical protein